MEDDPKPSTPTPDETSTAPTDSEAGVAMPKYKGAPLDAERGPEMPKYKGAALDPDRGPGLGCFWTQVVLLTVFLVLTPLTVVWAWPSWISAALLFGTLILLLFVGQTTIFLLRLVAADRRTARRHPMSPSARKTVGDLEEESTKSQQDDAGTG